MLPENLPTLLSQALAERGYTDLTGVQVAVSEPEAKGRDLLVSSKTGSGKTVAYGIAMAQDLLGEGGGLPLAGAPLALIIAPTRELALQVQRELEWLYAKTGARVVSCVGGMDPRREQRALSAGAHIVVGTPGRLRDHLERSNLDLSAIRVAVLDEADEMLDLGFREELEALLDEAPATRRTLLFSATLPKPILALARRYQSDAFSISIADGGKGHADIEYLAVTIAPSDVEHATVNLLRFFEPGSAIVFCSTREAVRRLHANLVERGFSAVALSGELTQNERANALQSLRDRRARVCVATDVAARGIDIPDLELVIHAELPHDPQVLQHRSGRTGRAGRKGISALLVPYPRRRKAEGFLRTANVQATWRSAPSADEIRAKDQERLINELKPDGEVVEDDLAIARVLLSGELPEVVVASLIRSHRANLPSPEDLVETRPEPPQQPMDRDKPRPGFEDTAWYSMDIGRNRNAEARWLLPMICRRGHITKLEIGAIRIFDRETRFEIVRKVQERFDASVAESADDGVHITPLADPDAPVKRDRAGFGRPGEKSERKPPQRRDGARHDGPRNSDAPRYEGPRLDTPRQDGPRQDAPRPAGPRHDGAPSGGGFKGKPRGPKPAFNRDGAAPPRDFKPRGKPPKRP